MKIGTTIRNMGAAATTACITHCAQAAEAAGLAHLWVVDHIAIPPDDAEGSDGRWLDPLAVLAFLAAATNRIELGVSVLVLPYRPALPTAKWIASIQELSGHRMHLGIGPGWMEAEFRALGVPRAERGRITDATVDFIRACFAAEHDVVSANGQPFLFRPCPPCPPIYVGGMTDAALARSVRVADGWLPMGIDADKLAPRIARLRELAAEAGRDCPQIVLIGSLPDEQSRAVAMLGACAELGASHFIQSSRYADNAGFERILARLEDLLRQLGPRG